MEKTMVIDSLNLTYMPLLPLRGLTCFPSVNLHFEVGRKKSVAALNYAMEHGRRIFLVTQKNILDEDPSADGLYPVGCVARIAQVLRLPDGGVKVLVEGLYRATFSDVIDKNDFLTAGIERLYDDEITNRPVYVEGLVRRIRREFELFASKGVKLAPDITLTVSQRDDIGYLTDFIVFNIPVPLQDKQTVLSELSPVKRAKLVIELLKKESQIVDIDRKIAEQVKGQIDDNQREYYLREQIKAINFELYGDTEEDEIEEYLSKIDKLSADDSVKEKLAKEVMKLQKMPQGSHEGTVVRNYLDLCLELPWKFKTAGKVDVKRAAKILDRDFYAMDKVKERVLEMLSVYALNPDIKGQIICLVGPPGVGKTSIARSIAECMGRKYARISLGGIHDEAEIRGHRKTYIGALPGKIITAVKDAGSSDPLILLDEIDKLGHDYKGDPAAALLEVLDGEQNDTFTDHFLDMPFDLSSAVFLTTANTEATIPEPLRDRMEIISLTSYTREEKFHIAKDHLLKRQIKNHGMTARQIKISDEALYEVIDFYTREAGVRKLERSVAALCRKSAKLIAENDKKSVRVTPETVNAMLGKRRYTAEEILPENEVGIINGLAWTSVGGEVMQLEVAVLSGTGKIELTGSLGDVMQESAKVALSYVRANAERYGINPDFYSKTDIHIHATEGAVPKDGPSAGVAITTALVSALTGRAVKRDVAMTGEVTVKGRVLPIGGLKEKSMAAYRAGVKTVFIPKDNAADLAELDKKVLENLRFVTASSVETVIENALLEKENEEMKANVIPTVKMENFESGRISQ